ncbi:ATP-binding protein [Aquincola sp. S2]|uniref:ATP-binding protein n=1 Tax=Pseudaquabacterium terrae TaxID=2732868 RepID=A0ABX2EIH2_9BURK|nr:ATP-binding protein [Aquabacterium terrae]NRF68414.1 ATP-binding protein [Aquabacterium terrae]
MNAPGLRIAILGAESTGKTWLARSLAERLALHTGLAVTWVPETLREWCDAAGRTPRRDEQAAIAAEQARRIDVAAENHALVLADTTPLATSVYSEHLFDDCSLHAAALAWQRGCALTLLTALDLPWIADGHQRDGPHVREPVDALLRRLLIDAQLPWSLIGGQGEARLDAALDAITPLLRRLDAPRRGLFTRLEAREAAEPPWRWSCEHCDAPDCEHALRRRVESLPADD